MTEKPIAIVTGVGPGTGAAIVKRFSAGGFRIIALARSAELINSPCARASRRARDDLRRLRREPGADRRH